MPCVPLICCSTTCATVSLTTDAFAPVYEVLTDTVGGEICGYWAIGSWNAASTPTMTMIIEMTIANIGRCIKNFDKMPPPYLFESEAVISFASNLLLSVVKEKPISSAVTMVTARLMPSCRFDRPSTTTTSAAVKPSLMM